MPRDVVDAEDMWVGASDVAARARTDCRLGAPYVRTLHTYARAFARFFATRQRCPAAKKRALVVITPNPKHLSQAACSGPAGPMLGSASTSIP